MPDLSAPVGALLEVLGPMLRVALGAVLRTALGMTLLVACICTASVYVAYGDGTSWKRSLLAGAFGLLLGAVLTGILAVKRAVGTALLHGLARLQVARRILSVVFDKLLGVEATTGVHGERGGRVAHAAEQMPLKQAEQRLNAVVHGMMGELATAGFLRRRIIETLLGKVSTLTLREFRDEAHHHGGVDLDRVRAALEPRIDGAIADTIDGALTTFTVWSVLGFSLLSLLVAFLLRDLPV